MNATITKKDRFLGCFLGGAVGDALGYPVEFVDETYIRKKYGPQGIQTLAQAGEGKGPAAITDDTQMTLFVINGLLYAKTSHQAPNGTCSALQNHVSDREAVWLAHQEWLGTQGDTSRMKDTKNPKMWLYRESRLHALRAPGGTCLSAQTHGHPLGYMSASALAVMLAAMVHYRPGEYKTLQDAILRSFTDSHSACAEIHDGLKKAVSLALDPSVSDLDGIHALGEGWVAEEALYIAVFCAVRYQNDFARAIRVAVNHKGDSDSTGSICGNILGAWLGKDAVEAAFDLKDLEMYDLIEEVATDFYQAVEEGIPVGDAQWDSKYRHGKKLPPEKLLQNQATQSANQVTPTTISDTSQPPVSPLRPVGLRYTGCTKRALQICFDAHKGQADKSGMPYVLHPIHLAEQMETEDEICTALLHDVLEDTDYTEEDLREAGISETILEALRLLTHDRSTPYMDYVMGTRENPLARKVKQADLLHNSDLGRLNQVTPYDLRQRRKYRIAQAILAEDEYDAAGNHYRKQIPLDDDRMYFLSVFYRKVENSKIVLLKYSLDVEKANDSHYEFGPSDHEKLQKALDGGYTGIKRSLPEALAEYFEDHGEMAFCSLLKRLKIRYQAFYFD